MEVEEYNNNNNSEGIKGDEVKVNAKTQKEETMVMMINNNLVAEEKGSPLDVSNDELETQFNACVMKHKMYKIKKGRKA